LHRRHGDRPVGPRRVEWIGLRKRTWVLQLKLVPVQFVQFEFLAFVELQLQLEFLAVEFELLQLQFIAFVQLLQLFVLGTLERIEQQLELEQVGAREEAGGPGTSPGAQSHLVRGGLEVYGA